MCTLKYVLFLNAYQMHQTIDTLGMIILPHRGRNPVAPQVNFPKPMTPEHLQRSLAI